MSVLNLLASQLGRNDELPNIELAKELVNKEKHREIEEIIENLSSTNKKIQNDCIKVAYEIGKLNPDFISMYSNTFLDLLKSRNNRLVWGSMQVLSTIAEVAYVEIMPHLNLIKSAMKIGSVITVDKGVLTMAKLAATNKDNNDEIFPFLLQHLENCRTKEIPQHAESILLAVRNDNKDSLLKVLRKREQYLTNAQLKRVVKIYKLLQCET